MYTSNVVYVVDYLRGGTCILVSCLCELYCTGLCQYTRRKGEAISIRMFSTHVRVRVLYV